MDLEKVFGKFGVRNDFDTPLLKANFYKKIANLMGIIVEIDKTNNKLNYNRFYSGEKLCISLSAIIWLNSDWLNFKKYTAIINISLPLSDENNIKWKLLSDIYQNAIKILL